MTHTEFGKMLNEVLEGSPYSKNEIIRRTGIDRSSFFQFLKGKRLPDPEKLQKILSYSEITPEGRTQILRALDEARYSDIAYSYIEIVRQCLGSVKEAEFFRTEDPGDMEIPVPEGREKLQRPVSGRNAVNSAIVRFIRASGGHPLDAFLPLEATRLLLRYRTIFGRGGDIRLLFHFPDFAGTERLHSASKFHDLIPLAITVDCDIRFFYTSEDLTEGAGLLYPYYIISGKGVLFLSAGLDAAFFSGDPALTDAFRDAYRKVLPLAERISDRDSSIARKQKMIGDLLKSGEPAQSLYLIVPSPCMTLLATEELVRAYAPEEIRDTFWQYASSLQAAHPIEIVSPEGIRSMAETGIMEENGIRIHLPGSVVHQALAGYRRRLGRTFFIGNTTHIAMPEAWSFLIAPGRSVSLIPYLSDGPIVSFFEKNVIGAFSAAFSQNLDYFVMGEKASGRMLDHYIRETSC